MAKKSIIVLLAISLLASMSCFLCGCDLVRAKSVEASAEQTVSDECLIEPGTLTVGIDASNTPYGGKNSSGDIIGYDVDYAAILAANMGLKVKIIDVSQSWQKALNKKQVDLVLGIEKQDSIEDNALTYTNAYINDGIALFCKADKAPTNISKVKFGSVKILAQAGTDTTYTVQKALGVDSIVVASSVQEAFEGLESGTANYLVCDAIEGAYYARNYSNVSFVNYMSEANIAPIYGAVVSTNTELSSSINGAIQTVASNGEQSTITSKWLSSTGLAFLPGNTDTSTLPKSIAKLK